MPRRKKLPPGYPTPPYVRPRGPKHECEHCGGVTRAVKGQTLDEAVAIHLDSCPGVLRINPRKKGT
jgi:hypothetical protein